jgi:hypothetical protein
VPPHPPFKNKYNIKKTKIKTTKSPVVPFLKNSLKLQPEFLTYPQQQQEVQDKLPKTGM